MRVETAQTFRKQRAEWKAKRDTCFAFESEAIKEGAVENELQKYIHKSRH